MATFSLSVVTPERTLFEGEFASVVVPAHEGYMGVMANHAPVISALGTGILEATDAQGIRRHVLVSGGFAEVSANKMIVLADRGELAGDIDIKDAEEQLERARRALRGDGGSMTAEEATKELAIAMNRIQAAKRKG